MTQHDDWPDESTQPFHVALLSHPPEPQPPSLQILTGPGAPSSFLLASEEVIVGRALDADIAIHCTELSRKHMALRQTGPGQWTVFDLDSRNGVYLNGLKIHAAVLHEGDSLQLGSVVLVFHEGRSA